MKIGILREGKIPPDRRVVLSPDQCALFQKQYTDKNRYDKFSVQTGLSPTKELYAALRDLVANG